MNRSMVRVFLLVVVGVLFAPTSFASAQIVALGSSTTRGNVPENEMWPAVLEGILHARGSQVHVKNAGVWGDTTSGVLDRVSSDVPDRTKIVILCVNAYNDNHRGRTSIINNDPSANIAAIKSKLAARGIKVIDVMPIYLSINRERGMSDGVHLSVEGNKKMATTVARMI
jgi:acyl-CoA thioesterase-1